MVFFLPYQSTNVATPHMHEPFPPPKEGQPFGKRLHTRLSIELLPERYRSPAWLGELGKTSKGGSGFGRFVHTKWHYLCCVFLMV